MPSKCVRMIRSSTNEKTSLKDLRSDCCTTASLCIPLYTAAAATEVGTGRYLHTADATGCRTQGAASSSGTRRVGAQGELGWYHDTTDAGKQRFGRKKRVP